MTSKATSFMPMKRIWLTAILVAVVSAVPVAILCKNYPWIIAIPVAVGVIFVVWLEFVAENKAAAQKQNLFSMPMDFRALSGYRGLAALLLPSGKEDQNQDFFDFLPSAKKRKQLKEAFKITDPKEGEMYVVDCERFVTLMVDKTLSNSDKIVEMSLKKAVDRYGQMKSHNEELQRLLLDSGVLDVIKSDYRGNLIQSINRNGEQILRDLLKQAKASEAKQKQSGELGVRL